MIADQPASPQRIQTISLMVLAAVAGTFSIYWLRPVLVPLVVAFMVVSGISPILTVLEKRLGVSRLFAAALTFLAGLVLMFVFGVSIWKSMVDLRSNSQDYRTRVAEIVNWAEARTDSWSRFFQGTDPEPVTDENAGRDAGLAGVGPNRDNDPSEFVDALVRDGISTISQALISLVSTSIVVMIYVFFLLIGTSTKSALPPTLREVDYQVRSYLTLKTVISIFTGAAFGTALWILGVPMSFTFGVLAFLLNFVPNIGPLVASVLPIPLILLAPDGTLIWMISTIVILCTIQGISGNLVEPKVMGNSSDLHPVTILVALMFWGMMWGVIGMFLATPVTAAIKILLQRFEATRSLAEWMAGRFTESEDASTRVVHAEESEATSAFGT
ncbi:MAG: AI-2E family transporter [Planctomycetota bacterium]